MTPNEFKQLLVAKGDEYYRDMPWRQDTRPYYVLVSELMLQQTQVGRVIPKFHAFIAAFPDEERLARASLAEVLQLWQGLGYNRRAKYLHDAAKIITKHGAFPDSEKGLLALPGVGVNTAGAILAYSYNKPAIFVETNIRTVYLHHFFSDDSAVSDKRIIAALKKTINHQNPRRFYQNLMDYGAWLKANGVKNINRSTHYKKQTPLEGSIRQMRGAIIRALPDADWTVSGLHAHFSHDPRFETALEGLVRDGLVSRQGRNIYLTE